MTENLGEKAKAYWQEFVQLVGSTEEEVKGWQGKSLDEELEEQGWKGQKAGAVQAYWKALQAPSIPPVLSGPSSAPGAETEIFSSLLSVVQFPRSLDIEALRRLLASPITPIFFREPVGTLAGPAYSSYCQSLHGALEMMLLDIPPATSSEMVWSGWWDAICVTLCNAAIKRDILRSVEVDRNVNDDSITQQDKKRDYLLWGRNILLVAGEDKKSGIPISESLNDLRTKNKASNSASYGDLGYIFCFATAGERIQFLALSTGPAPQLSSVTEVLDVSSLSQRIQAIHCFLNIFRWVRSVLGADILAQAAVKLKEHVSRPSPYSTLHPQGSIVIHSRHVEKVFFLPNSHYERFLDIYRFLVSNKDTPNMISIETICVSYDGNNKQAEDRTKKIDSNQFFTKKMVAKDGVWIHLKMAPIGARYVPNESNIKACFVSILSFLSLFHERGFVHRDLRWPNILRIYGDRWIVIDFELADCNDRDVFWRGDSLPVSVMERERKYNFVDDLGQVKQLIRSLSFPQSWNQFVDELCNTITTARGALDVLQTL